MQRSGLGRLPPNNRMNLTALRAARYPERVCQAWHRTSEVKVLAPGDRGAEGEEQGKGVTARWGLEEAQSKAPGDAQEPDTRWGTPGTSGHVTAKSAIRSGVGFINPAVTRETFGALPGEICRLSRTGLRVAGAARTGRQKSAEGIGGPRQAKLVRHPNAERRGNR